MRSLYNRHQNGTKTIRWLTVMVTVVMIYVLVIASAEVFWYLFTGGLSWLIGGYALVAATLVAIRVVGTTLANPYRWEDMRFRSL